MVLQALGDHAEQVGDAELVRNLAKLSNQIEAARATLRANPVPSGLTPGLPATFHRITHRQTVRQLERVVQTTKRWITAAQTRLQRAGTKHW
jgi:hypothetical protein